MEQTYHRWNRGGGCSGRLQAMDNLPGEDSVERVLSDSVLVAFRKRSFKNLFCCKIFISVTSSHKSCLYICTPLQSPENLVNLRGCSYQVTSAAQREQDLPERQLFWDVGSSREVVEWDEPWQSRQEKHPPGYRERWKSVRSLLSKLIYISKPNTNEAKTSGKKSEKLSFLPDQRTGPYNSWASLTASHQSWCIRGRE